MDLMRNMDEYIKLEKQLAEYQGRDKVVSALELKAQFKENPLELTKFYSNFQKLNNLTDGFATSELVVISAATKMGKTIFCQSLTRDYYKYKHKMLWFTFEIPLRPFFEKFDVMPEFYVPQENTEENIDWIERRIIEARCKYDINIVFIDHLHYLVPLSQKVNFSLMIGAAMRRLKQLCMRYNILIFLVAHTNKASFNRKPMIGDLRDSSFVAQEADFVIMMYREVLKNSEEDNPVYLNTSQIGVVANRRTGDLGWFKVVCKHGLFSDD